MLLTTPAHSQVLQGVFNIDTRHLFTSSDLTKGWWEEGRIDPVMLPSVSGLRFRTVSIYDDVYRETGTQRRNQVNRFEHASYLEVPLGARQGGLGIEFSHLAANVRSNPSSEEKSYLGWSIQRLSAGIGRHVWQRRLTVGSRVGVTRMAGSWLPAGSLALIVRPHKAVSLTVRAGRRPDLRILDWRIEEEQYHAEIKLWQSWWAAGLRLDFLPRLLVNVEYKRDRTHALARWYKGDGFGFDPGVNTEGVKAVVQIHPAEGTSVEMRWRTLSMDSICEAFHNGDKFGKLTEFLLNETNVELIGAYRFTNSTQVALTYGDYRVTSRQQGHMDPWPFSATIFVQILRTYYRGSGEARVNRLAARYTRDKDAREDWTFQVGYVWMTPDFELLQRRTKLIIFFDSDELVRSYLNIIHAEFLVPEVRKTFALGGMILTYAFAKAIPTRIRLREAPPPVEPPEEKVEARGGSFHLLSLSYVW